MAQVQEKNLKAPKAPNLPALESANKLTACRLEDELALSNFELNEAILDNQQAKHLALTSGRLIKVSLAGTCLSKARMTDILIDKCNASNGEWAASKLSRVAITGSRLIGLKLLENQINDLSLYNCLGDMMQLFGSKCKNVSFVNCRLKKADFRSCELEDVSFYNCDMTEAEFYGVKLKNVDFSGSKLDGIKASALDLKGAIIDAQQMLEMAEYMAKLLGIKVKRN